MDTCETCKGTGRAKEEWQTDEGCETCESYGWVPDPSDGGTMTCPDCDGDSAENCEECEGTGWIA
jgi:DnaJ-class molecular chaperone